MDPSPEQQEEPRVASLAKNKELNSAGTSVEPNTSKNRCPEMVQHELCAGDFGIKAVGIIFN